MKKLLAILLTASMLIGALTLMVSAETPVTCVDSQLNPDWLITEICQDTLGDGTIVEGYNDKYSGKDVFEFIEIYNNSDRVLDLYEYCLTYNGDGRTDSRFETKITETTPFLTKNTYEDKVGNYLDGSTFLEEEITYSQTLADGTKEVNKLVVNDSLKNPENCLVEPGECVMLWIMYYEAYLSKWHDNPATPEVDGTGMTVDDFRKFYNVPEGVKVICVDGNSNTTYGGCDCNFNIKNSGCGTYGIAKYSADLNEKTNVIDETTKKNKVGGYTDALYYLIDSLVCWASMDIDSGFPGTATSNYSTNFVTDLKGYSADMWRLTYSGGRMAVLEYNCPPTPGALTDLQKLYICPEKLKAGDTVQFKSTGMNDYIFTADKPKTETTKYTFAGWLVNGTKYVSYDSFTVPAGGVTSLDYVYDEKAITTEATETDKPTDSVTDKTTDTDAPDSKTETEKDSSTNATSNTDKPVVTTDKTTSTKAPEETTKKNEGSCGSFAVAAQLIALFCGSMAFIIVKKYK